MNANTAAIPSRGAALRVELEHPNLEPFSLLMQEGVCVPCDGPCTVRHFLTGPLGLDPDYARDRVQTVFRDGLAVDDMETATVKPGTRLALSAALPGLAGATMRKGGALAGMRGGITCKPESVEPGGEPFLVTVRFFNQVGAEVCGPVLGRGVYVDAAVLERFLSLRTKAFLDGFTSVMTVNEDDTLAPASLASLANGDQVIHLTVRGGKPE